MNNDAVALTLASLKRSHLAYLVISSSVPNPVEEWYPSSLGTLGGLTLPCQTGPISVCNLLTQ